MHTEQFLSSLARMITFTWSDELQTVSKIECNLFVVYFDQQTGAPQAIRWSKSFFMLKQLFTSFSIITVVTVECISSSKLVNTKNIRVMNQIQPVLLSQPHLER